MFEGQIAPLRTVWRSCGLCALMVGLFPVPIGAQPIVSAIPDPTAYGLHEIQDNTWLRHEENSAYYGLLHHAQQVPPAELRLAAREFTAHRTEILRQPNGRSVPLFKDMLDQPQVYRGQPITLRGHLQQVTTYPAAENDWGIETLYEASFFEEDAQGNLATLVFLELPPGLAVGDELVDHVTVHGYFLKTYFYDAQDLHTHKAPLILARTLEIKPIVTSKPWLPGWLVSLLAVVAACLVLALIVWVQRRDQALRRQSQQGQLPERLTEAIPAPAQITLPDLPGELPPRNTNV